MHLSFQQNAWAAYTEHGSLDVTYHEGSAEVQLAFWLGIWLSRKAV